MPAKKRKKTVRSAKKRKSVVAKKKIVRVVKKKVVRKAAKVIRRVKPVARAKKKKIVRKKPVEHIAGVALGAVTHYFPHVLAAVLKLKAPLAVGDQIRIKGHTTDFAQPVDSIQIDRVAITSAKKGDEIGLHVASRVRRRDKVYKI